MESDEIKGRPLGPNTFAPGICCAHVWLTVGPAEVCDDCGARCVRGPHGRIAEYDRTYNWGKRVDPEDVQEAERRSSRRRRG